MHQAEFPPLTPQELAVTGQALFGAGWRTELARTFGISETQIVMVESGRAQAPGEWRAKLVQLAQDTALRALEAANNLMWRENGEAAAPLYASPRYA